MGLTARLFLFIYLVGALLLNSCHQVSSQLKSKPMGERVNGLRLYSEGPNCWNGALLKTGLVHSVRFVPKGEYWFWMQSHYCRQLSLNEKPQKGDLGSVFWSGHGHYHSFIYLDDQWVFSKNSPDPKYEYKVQRFEDMFNEGHKSKAKRCWQNNLARQKQNCEFRVAFHRCHPLEKDFFSGDKSIKAWDQMIKPLEEQVFSWTVGDSSLSLGEYEQTVGKLYAILLDIQKSNGKSTDKLKTFRIEALEYRVLGLILADIKVAHMIPKLYPFIQYAYHSQNQKKHYIPLYKD